VAANSSSDPSHVDRDNARFSLPSRRASGRSLHRPAESPYHNWDIRHEAGRLYLHPASDYDSRDPGYKGEMAGISSEEMSARIAASRREAEGLKDRIKRRKDDLQDTTCKSWDLNCQLVLDETPLSTLCGIAASLLISLCDSESRGS